MRKFLAQFRGSWLKRIKNANSRKAENASDTRTLAHAYIEIKTKGSLVVAKRTHTPIHGTRTNTCIEKKHNCIQIKSLST